MASADDALAAPTAVRLAAHLGTRWLGRAYEWHASCESTNDLAGARARAGAPQGLVVATEQQIGGARAARARVALARRREPVPLDPAAADAARARDPAAHAARGRGRRARARAPRARAAAQVAERRAARRRRARPRKVAGHPHGDDERGRARRSRRRRPRPQRQRPRLPRRARGARDVAAARRGPTPSSARPCSPPCSRSLEPLYEAFEARGAAAASEAWQPFAALGERCRVSAPGAPLEGVTLGVDADGALRLRDDAGHIHRVLSGEIST